jgi:phosphonate transport system substrate-binding protein
VEPLAAPVLTGERYTGRPIYYSDVIVHRDSPITRIQELQGRSWAYNEPASHSGHSLTLYALVRMGARPGFVASVVEAGFHQRAIRLVASGRVDAAAIDSQVLAVEFRDHPQVAASLRVIGSFGPSTIQPVVAASRLPDQLKTAVREVLLGLGGRAEAKSALAQVSSRASWRSAIGTTTTSGPCSPPSTPLATPPSASKPPATRLAGNRATPGC